MPGGEPLHVFSFYTVPHFSLSVAFSSVQFETSAPASALPPAVSQLPSFAPLLDFLSAARSPFSTSSSSSAAQPNLPSSHHPLFILIPPSPSPRLSLLPLPFFILIHIHVISIWRSGGAAVRDCYFVLKVLKAALIYSNNLGYIQKYHYWCVCALTHKLAGTHFKICIVLQFQIYVLGRASVAIRYTFQ